MTNKKPAKSAAIINRRASFDYQLGDELVVGLQLTGLEVRAARDGHVQLRGSYVTIRDGQLWLNNASFSLKQNQAGVSVTTSVDSSPRKLLAHRQQIDQLAKQNQAGNTIVPLRLLNKANHIKLVIALGKGKKHYDKRETLKRRDQEREARRQLKRY